VLFFGEFSVFRNRFLLFHSWDFLSVWVLPPIFAFGISCFSQKLALQTEICVISQTRMKNSNAQVSCQKYCDYFCVVFWSGQPVSSGFFVLPSSVSENLFKITCSLCGMPSWQFGFPMVNRAFGSVWYGNFPMVNVALRYTWVRMIVLYSK
jgi:hypothetical protein